MALVVAPKVRPLRRPLIRTVAVSTLTLAAGVGAMALGATFMIPAMVVFYGSIIVSVIGRRRLTAANRRIAELPFPVTHSRAGAVDADGYQSRIHTATVRLAGDHAALAEAATALVAWVPALSVAIHDDALVLTQWPWGSEDLLLLAAVLDGWGRGVHATHAIAEVVVDWGEGGPRLGI